MTNYKLIVQTWIRMTGRKSKYYTRRLHPLTWETFNDIDELEERLVGLIKVMRRTKRVDVPNRNEYTDDRNNHKILTPLHRAAYVQVVPESVIADNRHDAVCFERGKDNTVSAIQVGMNILLNEEAGFADVDVEHYTELCKDYNYGRFITLPALANKMFMRAIGIRDKSGYEPIFGKVWTGKLHQADVVDIAGEYTIENGKGIREIDMTAAYVWNMANFHAPKNTPIKNEVIKGYVAPTEHIIYRYRLINDTVWCCKGKWSRKLRPSDMRNCIDTTRFMPVSDKHYNALRDFMLNLRAMRSKSKGIYKMMANSFIGYMKHYAPQMVQMVYDIQRNIINETNRALENMGHHIQANHTDGIRFWSDANAVEPNLDDFMGEWRYTNDGKPFEVYSYGNQVQQMRDPETGRMWWKHAGIRGECPEWGKADKSYEWTRPSWTPTGITMETRNRKVTGDK